LKEWHVEDAGGGCKAFSEILVLVCEETRELFATALPLTWDDGYSFEEKACSQLTGLMEKARVQKSDHLVVCSGNIFNSYHNWLNENGYSWDIGKIDGLAHDLAEYLFHTQAIEAGFPPELQLVERNYREYYSLIEKWVGAEPERQIFWKDREVRRKPAQTRYILKCNSGHSRSCQQCRQKIRPYAPIVVYRYRENGRRIKKYYHPACTPVTPLKSTLETLVVNWDSTKVEGVILITKEEKRTCSICGQTVDPGEHTFYGYINDQVITGHPACFKKEKDAVRGA
jgi:hypothetical protein